GDVQVAHDLQAGDHRAGDLFWEPQLFLAKTVNAVADDEVLFHRLDVDVGRSGNVRVLDDPIGELNDRGGLFALQVRGLHLAAAAVGVGGADHFGDRADVDILRGRRSRGFRVLEEFLQQAVEQRGGDDTDFLDDRFR